MNHELWVDPDGFDTFCLAGPEGDAARALLPNGSVLEWTVEAANNFDAMCLYYSYRGHGQYTTDHPELDKQPYPVK